MKINLEQINAKEGYEPVRFSALKDLADGSVDEILCEDFIHICPDLIALLDGFYRVLKQGGKVTIFVPYWTSARAWMDPRTKRLINEGTFLSFNKSWREANRKPHSDLPPCISDFDAAFSYVFDPDFDSRSDGARAFALKYYNNSVLGFQIILTKR